MSTISRTRLWAQHHTHTLTKETYIYYKRDRTGPFTPLVRVIRDLQSLFFLFCKRDQYTLQKRPTYTTKETSRALRLHFRLRAPKRAVEWVMSHIWMSHVTHMNESCHTYEWVMSHIQMSYVTHMNESCHTYRWVMSHIWMSHVTHMNESWHTYRWVISQIQMSHVTHANESCHT